jgi:hypothetical protein
MRQRATLPVAITATNRTVIEVEFMTSEQVLADARKTMERIAEDSCVWGRAQGWNVRWEWRGNSVWLIDETHQPPTETEMFDVVPLPEAMQDLEVEGNG